MSLAWLSRGALRIEGKHFPSAGVHGMHSVRDTMEHWDAVWILLRPRQDTYDAIELSLAADIASLRVQSSFTHHRAC